MYLVNSLAILVIVTVHGALSLPLELNQEIPKLWKPCSRNDPNLDDCLRASVESIRPSLANGIPELLIPPLDPLEIPEINIKQNSGAIRLDSEYSNVIISGLSNFTIRDLHVDKTQHRFRIDLWFPMLQMKANYNINGKVLLLALNGTGPCTGNFTDVDATVTMENSIVSKEKANSKHLNVSDVKVEFNIGGATIQLDNLFNGDADLGALMNKFLNDHWREVTSEVRPALAEAIEHLLRMVASRLFDTYSIDKILS